MAKVPFYDTLTGESGTDDIPDSVIRDASAESYRVDRKMAIGQHPVFGWVYRDWEDEGGTAELTNIRVCYADGIID